MVTVEGPGTVRSVWRTLLRTCLVWKGYDSKGLYGNGGKIDGPLWIKVTVKEGFGRLYGLPLPVKEETCYHVELTRNW